MIPLLEYQGEILAKVGYGMLAREFLKPIADNIKITSNESYVKPEDKYSTGFWVDQYIKGIIKPEPPILLQFCIPPLFNKKPDRFNIGMCIWDTDKYPLEWLSHMSNMDAIIFPHIDAANIAKNCGVSCPIAYFSPYVDRARWLTPGNMLVKNATGIKYIVEEDWGPQGNLEDVVQGFCIAFEGNKEVSLIIKINNARDTNQKRIVRGEIQNYIGKLKGLNKPNILIIDDQLTEEESNDLIASCNYYINLRGSCSFDLQSIRAASLGIPTISTSILNRPASLITYKVQAYSVPVLNGGAFYRFNQFTFKPDIRSYVVSLIYSFNTIKSDRLKYSGQVNALKEAAKIYDSTNLLEVAMTLYEGRKPNAKTYEQAVAT